MKRFLKSLALGILLALPWVGAQAQQVNNYCWVDAGPPVHWAPCNSTTPLAVSGSLTPSGNTTVIGPTADGSPATTPPVLIAGTTDGTGTGTVGVLQVTTTGAATVAGPTADGSPAVTPPVLIGGTVDGSATGNVGVAKVDAAGLAYNAITNWGGGALGAMANYGTSPGAILVPGVNAFVTNTVTVTGTVTSSASLGITPTDRTVTSATGSSQQMMAANASRHSMTIENTGNANCGVNPTGGTAVIAGAGTITLVPLGSYTPRVPTLSAVTVICTSGQPIYGDEN